MKAEKVRSILFYIVTALIILAMGYMLFRSVPVVFGAGSITLDGAFADWSGQSCISDPPDDAAGPDTDILQFCFATNAGDSSAYFMIQRSDKQGGKPLNLTIYFDTDNNGVYTDAGDTSAQIYYKPKNTSSEVQVTYAGGSASGDWGEDTTEGGMRVEWSVPFSSMGIAPGQAIRMYVVSWQGSAVSDGTDEVQWSPANALGWILLAVLLVTGSLVLAFTRMRIEKKAPPSPSRK
jgi:hypothetical protein